MTEYYDASDFPSGPPVEQAIVTLVPASRASAITAPLPYDSLLVDRPFVQHVLEWLIGQGVRRVELLGRPQDMETHRWLVDSSRWGCEIGWHALERTDALTDEVRRLCGAAGPWLVARGDALPLRPLGTLVSNAGAEDAGLATLICEGSAQRRPVGWAIADSDVWNSLPPHGDQESLSSWLRTLSARMVAVPGVLRCATPAELLASQRLLLDGAGEGHVRLYGRELTPGVRRARNTHVDRQARLIGPVFIGDNSRIGPGAVVGPHAVIGANCLVDRDAVVRETVVEPETYVGPSVQLVDCVVRGEIVHHARLGASVRIDDKLLVSRV